MTDIATDTDAASATARANDLLERVVSGSVHFDKEEAIIAEANDLFARALKHYRDTANTRQTAAVLDSPGFMARHAEAKPALASAFLIEAAALFGQIGAPRERIATLLELGEIDPGFPATNQAVIEFIEAGLPDDLHHLEDPKRLAFAKNLSGDIDGSLTLYDQLIEEALSRNAKPRAAMLLRDAARICENGQRDKVRATEKLERALALAEESGCNEETGAALLRLTDIWSERRKNDKAREYFTRLSKLRGLPSWQRKLIRPMRSHFEGA